MRRVRDVLGLVPVEYPTTRVVSSPQERAADLMAAFADPDIRAVLATIGGDDQITVLRHLDPEVVRADPKPFVGYSDNTNLLNWLWFHGVEGVHGGSTQVQLGPGPAPDPEYLTSLRAALFGGDVDPRAGRAHPRHGAAVGRPARAHRRAARRARRAVDVGGPAAVVTGRRGAETSRSSRWTLEVGRFVLPVEAYAGCVLVLEPSEEMPSPEETYRGLRNLGERGVLGAASSLLWARPFASSREHPRTEAEASTWRAEHRDQVLRAVAEYNPDLVVALDVDFGHTSPQWVLPYGGRVTVDGAARTVTAHFTR